MTAGSSCSLGCRSVLSVMTAPLRQHIRQLWRCINEPYLLLLPFLQKLHWQRYRWCSGSMWKHLFHFSGPHLSYVHLLCGPYSDLIATLKIWWCRWYNIAMCLRLYVAGDCFCRVCNRVQLGSYWKAVQPAARWNLPSRQVCKKSLSAVGGKSWEYLCC